MNVIILYIYLEVVSTTEAKYRWFRMVQNKTITTKYVEHSLIEYSILMQKNQKLAAVLSRKCKYPYFGMLVPTLICEVMF